MVSSDKPDEFLATPRAQLFFKNFAQYFLSDGYLCSYDYIQINGGRKFCGYTAPQPISSLGQLELSFVSDYMITDKGWAATYETSGEC